MTDQLSPADHALAKSAFESSEGELLLALGMTLGGGDARDTEPQDLRSRAEAWLRRHNERLRAAICGQPGVHELENSITDVAAVADLLATQLNKPTAFTVAAILLKRGIRAWCAA